MKCFCIPTPIEQTPTKLSVNIQSNNKIKHNVACIVMQEASDALSKTADSDTVSTYQVSSVQLVTDKKLEACNKT